MQKDYHDSMSYTLLQPNEWKEYELLDAGDEEKLERFGKFTVVRPEPQALWKRTLPQSEWNKADAMYQRSSTGGGKWMYQRSFPQQLILHWEQLSFVIKPTGFKHMGIFPEQAAFWKWIQQTISSAQRPIKVLNLFAYTGGSTVAALSAGAQVTHVDSSKEIITWAHENVKQSGLEGKPVRWIIDDVLKFIKREVKRGVTYDAIIMDPPKFGRGSSGQVWKIEEDLPVLIQLCEQVLSAHPLFFLMNLYTTDYSALTLQNQLSDIFHHKKGIVDCGELVLSVSASKKLLSTGVYARWQSPESNNR